MSDCDLAISLEETMAGVPRKRLGPESLDCYLGSRRISRTELKSPCDELWGETKDLDGELVEKRLRGYFNPLLQALKTTRRPALSNYEE